MCERCDLSKPGWYLSDLHVMDTKFNCQVKTFFAVNKDSNAAGLQQFNMSDGVHGCEFND